MKKIIMLLLLLFPTFTFAEEVKVFVKGMVCSFCAQGIKKTFEASENVVAVNVDLEGKTVTIKTKEGTVLSDNQIKEIVNDAGYEVGTIFRHE